jgi:anti-anti-sigma factor
MNETLAIQKESRRGFYLIKMVGSFSAGNILNIRAAFDESQKKNCRKVAIDLSAVEFIDSMGIGILINFNKRMAKSQGQLLLVNPSAVVSEIFEVSDTDKYIKVRNVDSAALESAFD